MNDDQLFHYSNAAYLLAERRGKDAAGFCDSHAQSVK